MDQMPIGLSRELEAKFDSRVRVPKTNVAVPRPSVTRKKVHWPVLLFVLGLAWPCAIFIGPLRMSLYRIVLVAMILPCAAKLLAGKAGRIRLADIALLLFSLWCMISLIEVNGFDPAIQSGGIIFIETAGPYLLARCYVQNAEDFYNVIQLLFRIVVFLLPFALIEFVSGENILRDVIAALCPTLTGVMPPRLGFTRVQSVFDHPILFGVFTGSIFAPVYLVLGYSDSFFQRSFKTGIIGLSSVVSLSSGPVIAVILQGLLLSWNTILGGVKSRWKILIAGIIISVLIVQTFANRSIPAIVAGYLAFDQQSYWFRTVIWQYGSAAALDHPLFGFGLSSWERPAWMPSSIDNLWLFLAVKHGLAAPVLLLGALLAIFLTVGYKKGLDDKMTAYRTAYLITLAAFFLVAWTVTFWDAAYVLFMFLMGCGAWILELGTSKTPASRNTESPRTRFSY